MRRRILHDSLFHLLLCLSATAWLISTATALVAAPTNSLQSLVNDTAAQIQLAYRLFPVEREHRHEQLAAVLAAWRAAPHSETNNDRLASWLHAAIRTSMPGSHGPLPAMPSFVSEIKADAPTPKNKPPEKAKTAPEAKPEADPFRDDPATSDEPGLN